MALEELIKESKEVLKGAGLEEVELEIPKRSEYGELTCSNAFKLSKKLSKKPYEIALEVCSKVNIKKEGLIDRIEPHSSGFINVYANWKNYARLILENVLEKNDSYGKANLGRSKKVLIEHTSVNPNKPLHIGHARNVCLGDTLARLFKFLGYDVTVANYIDDSGSQMAELMLGFLKLGYPMKPPEGMRFDEYCGDIVYVEANKALEKDLELQRYRRELAKAIEDKGSKEYVINQAIVKKVLEDQLRTCKRLGAKHDVLNKESDVIAMRLWDDTFNVLKSCGLIYRAEEGPKAGCILIDLSGHEKLSKEGDEVLVRSDGSLTYVAKDIAFAFWKLGVIKSDFLYTCYIKDTDGSTIWITDVEGEKKLKLAPFDLTINVIDVRQSRLQEIIKYALEKVGFNGSRYIHFSYEVVALSPNDAKNLGIEIHSKMVHMKGREGLYIKAEAMLDKLKQEALKEVKKRHAGWDDSKAYHVAEKIAQGTLRYELIKGDADKVVVFDSYQASKLEGNTSSYLQYSYARACRILEKATDELTHPVPYGELAEEEKQLLRKISVFPKVVKEVVDLLMIKVLANYAYELAEAFNNFYESCRVLGQDKNTTSFRLSLVKAYKITMNNALWLLGVPALKEI